MIFCFYQTS